MSGLLLPTPIRRGVSPEDFAALLRSPIYETEDEGARRDALIAASWVLVRCDTDGERWRCRGCNQRHTHFTLGCIPRPFKGLTDGLRAYWHNLGGADRRDLSPVQQQSFDHLTSLFGPTVALSDRHPETARALKTGANDLDTGAHILGIIDPISALQASVYAERINYRARRVIVRFP